jgi:hypothetical protein
LGQVGQFLVGAAALVDPPRQNGQFFLGQLGLALGGHVIVVVLGQQAALNHLAVGRFALGHDVAVLATLEQVLIGVKPEGSLLFIGIVAVFALGPQNGLHHVGKHHGLLGVGRSGDGGHEPALVLGWQAHERAQRGGHVLGEVGGAVGQLAAVVAGQGEHHAARHQRWSVQGPDFLKLGHIGHDRQRGYAHAQPLVLGQQVLVVAAAQGQKVPKQGCQYRRAGRQKQDKFGRLLEEGKPAENGKNLHQKSHQQEANGEVDQERVKPPKKEQEFVGGLVHRARRQNIFILP